MAYTAYVVMFDLSTREYMYSENFGFGLNAGLPPPNVSITGGYWYETDPVAKLVELCSHPPRAEWSDSDGVDHAEPYDILNIYRVHHSDVEFRFVDGRWVEAKKESLT